MKTELKASEFSAHEAQAKRLEERKKASSFFVKVCGEDFIVDPGVYDTGVDTELMAEVVNINKSETFLEVGSGTGAISLLLSKRCLSGVAVDINPKAICNTKKNAERLNIKNVSFVEGNCFENIKEKFNVLICNPPYNNCVADDFVERMFWDPGDDLKKKFFAGAAEHLLPSGRVYFGWANFQDLDIELPLKLAQENGLSVIEVFERSSHSGKYVFYVFEFVLADNPQASH